MFADGRVLGSALYFLVTPHAPVRLHRIRNDQLYHYYLGDPIEVFLLHGDDRGPPRRWGACHFASGLQTTKNTGRARRADLGCPTQRQ